VARNRQGYSFGLQNTLEVIIYQSSQSEKIQTE